MPRSSSVQTERIRPGYRGEWLSGAEQLRAPALELCAELAPDCEYSARKLAQRMNISLRQLQRLFASSGACAPQDWLNQQRLLRARAMLREARSVKEVAYTLGFSRMSQFSRDFRLQFGLVPSSLLIGGELGQGVSKPAR